MAKTWLIVKEECFPLATTIFEGSITKESKQHLGAAIGSEEFKQAYVREKVATWVQGVDQLTTVAETQPHAAYAAFTHGLASKWTFLTRIVPDTGDLFQPLEDAIQQCFLPTLTGQSAFNDNVRNLIALPSRLGGLGIINPARQVDTQHQTSHEVTTPLVRHIIEQSKDFPLEAQEEQIQAKHAACQAKRQAQISEANNIQATLPSSLQKAVEIAKETGASTWLTALPITEHGFSFHKGAFRDALCLQYGWRPHYYHCNVYVIRA